MKIRHALGAVAAALIASALVAAPASASTKGSITVEQIPGVIQNDLEQRDELFALAEEQSPEEVQQLLAEAAEAHVPMDILVDVETGVQIAATPSEAPISTFAIDMKCLDNPAKLTVTAGAKEAVYCFRGTGTYTGTWGPAIKLSAGAYTTTAWYGSSLQYGVWAAAGNTQYFSSPVTVKKITRS
ncbi:MULTISPECIES: hypothetical protein [unclassified Microbacterium]|uniref:hypothetical protein n=1 Tax=unclassified Microbacterium TaxID=2609290 RepID=UPI0021A7E0D1|nr:MULTISPECIES: hypothetical protein [unclassified Microbacterium]MCT1364032.1 hypothetical protein [Microbacterium sp. p3-SID131]MCT1375326.1 hypothetical protein [Microbacterium sp. p3-SID337]